LRNRLALTSGALFFSRSHLGGSAKEICDECVGAPVIRTPSSDLTACFLGEFHRAILSYTLVLLVMYLLVKIYGATACEF
jgi:hypothetical protein